MFQAAFLAWVRGGLGFRQGFRRRSPDTQLATVTCSGSGFRASGLSGLNSGGQAKRGGGHGSLPYVSRIDGQALL